jgi:hypothetical protein
MGVTSASARLMHLPSAMRWQGVTAARLLSRHLRGVYVYVIE